jgi:hypothetical protein
MLPLTSIVVINAQDGNLSQSILDNAKAVGDKIMNDACKIDKDACQVDRTASVSDVVNDSKSERPGIILLSKRFNEGGKYGYDKILGQVKNVGNTSAYGVEIGATIFDKNGDVIASKTGYPQADILKPNQKSTFDITFLSFENLDGMDSYELSLKWKDSDFDSTPQFIDNVNVTKN